jgi:DNA-binding beta-propeller fold protein YncE
VPTPQPPNFGGFYGSFARNAIGAPGNEMKNCIFVLGADGRPLEIWTQWDELCPGVHKVRISPYDPERRVWVVNERRNQVLVFSNDGKQLLMTIGEANVAGNDQTHLSRPQDLAFMPDGSVLVTDGNSRIVRFDKAGKFVMQWGTPGNQPGQFGSMHAIAVDKNRRVYVGDRGNDRVQVFDEQGKFLAAWPNMNFLMDILVSDATQDIWVNDNQTTKLIKMDANGTRHLEWDLHKGTPGLPGLFYELHQISVDPDGTLYGIDNVYGRIQKFRPKPGADKAKLILPPMPLMPKTSK